MSVAADGDPATSLVIDFGQGGNSDAFAREGWRACEPRHRWSMGARNLLVLPALARSRQFALTVYCDPAQPPSVAQNLALEFNQASLGVLRPRRGVPLRLVVPGDIVNKSGDNTLVCLNPNVPSSDRQSAGNRPLGALAFAWRRLELSPDDTVTLDAPDTLPEPEDVAALNLQAVVGLYQSLGRNCELGIFQRRCGAEPIGLLRFASVFADRLVQGLRQRFAGIETATELSLVAPRAGGELMGRHALYGLSYHTFKKESEVDVEALRASESRRLGYLARLLIEQIENDEKIFVRLGEFESEGEFRALHQLLRVYNPQARLLMVQAAPPSEPERAGHVERLAPNLYRAFLSSFADPARVPSTLAYDDWLKICATLFLDQKEKGRVDAAG